MAKVTLPLVTLGPEYMETVGQTIVDRIQWCIGSAQDTLIVMRGRRGPSFTEL